MKLKKKKNRKQSTQELNTSTGNREYKDRLFNFIFGQEDHKDWTLSLYNAVNGSDYKDPSEIEFNTLKDVLFLGMRNDTSFLISGYMSVYEHQSSYNPNMPLRMLEYVGELYSGYVTYNGLNKYGSTLIMLPTPRLVVFYNGVKKEPDEIILRLTDSFDKSRRDKSDVEVKVRMININLGHNKALMDMCKPLSEYAEFTDLVRGYKTGYGLTGAVKKAIDDLPEDYLIKGFLAIHKSEVEGMLDREYDEENVKELFQIEVEREKQRADEAETRADEAETRAEVAEKRVAELEALLAAK